MVVYGLSSFVKGLGDEVEVDRLRDKPKVASRLEVCERDRRRGYENHLHKGTGRHNRESFLAL